MKAFNAYYQDELAFLREMGREFARAYPAMAQFLADRGSDPDVERLLEGFAFLAGRIRQKLDDEFPEIIHALMQLLCPHYLRPVPAFSLVEFSPIPAAVRERQGIPRGTTVDSVPVEGTPCHFQTCYDMELYPFTLEQAGLESLPDGRVGLALRFALPPGLTTGALSLSRLRLHLFGEPAYSLYLWLCRHVSQLLLRTRTQGQTHRPLVVESPEIDPVGFAPEEALLPYPGPSFEGYRLLQEYFAFPEKFLFVDLRGLGGLSQLPPGEAFECLLVFDRAPEAGLRVQREHIRLYTTPVVNLFPMESDPIRVDHTRTEYRIRPAGGNPDHYEIYSVDRALGWVRGTVEERAYAPFYSFRLSQEGATSPVFYQVRFRQAVVGDGLDAYVSFVDPFQRTALPPTETVVFHLTCTNRNLPERLRVGDIQVPTPASPEFVRFRNITRVTPSIRPPLGGDLPWRLATHLALNQISLSDLRALRALLELYNFPALRDRQAAQANHRRIQGIQSVEAQVVDRWVNGTALRGTQVRVILEEDHFAGEGDRFLFGTILNEVLALSASVNTFTQVQTRGARSSEVHRWPPKLGRQTLL